MVLMKVGLLVALLIASHGGGHERILSSSQHQDRSDVAADMLTSPAGSRRCPAADSLLPRILEAATRGSTAPRSTRTDQWGLLSHSPRQQDHVAAQLLIAFGLAFCPSSYGGRRRRAQTAFGRGWDTARGMTMLASSGRKPPPRLQSGGSKLSAAPGASRDERGRRISHQRPERPGRHRPLCEVCAKEVSPTEATITVCSKVVHHMCAETHFARCRECRPLPRPPSPDRPVHQNHGCKALQIGSEGGADPEGRKATPFSRAP